jgi:hypothetical protein
VSWINKWNRWSIHWSVKSAYYETWTLLPVSSAMLDFSWSILKNWSFSNQIFCPVKCESKIFWITDIFYYNYVNCLEKWSPHRGVQYILINYTQSHNNIRTWTLLPVSSAILDFSWAILKNWSFSNQIGSNKNTN